MFFLSDVILVIYPYCHTATKHVPFSLRIFGSSCKMFSRSKKKQCALTFEGVALGVTWLSSLVCQNITTRYQSSGFYLQMSFFMFFYRNIGKRYIVNRILNRVSMIWKICHPGLAEFVLEDSLFTRIPPSLRYIIFISRKHDLIFSIYNTCIVHVTIINNYLLTGLFH